MRATGKETWAVVGLDDGLPAAGEPTACLPSCVAVDGEAAEWPCLWMGSGGGGAWIRRRRGWQRLDAAVAGRRLFCFPHEAFSGS